MRMKIMLPGFLAIVLHSMPAFSQSHYSNWVHRNAMDTTIVECVNDSMGTFHFPAGSMGMMFPDSVFCRAEIMCLDSLPFPHDSTVLGWCRFQMGTDSMHFDMMNTDTMHGGHHQMGFMRNLECELHWDSLFCDSTHRGWHLTGIMGWNGSSWTMMPGVSISANSAGFTTTQLYSAFAFVGSPSGPTSVRENETPRAFALGQNYPNPFNPSTTIRFTLPVEGRARLTVFNLIGQKVASLIDAVLPAGEHAAVWDGGSNLSAPVSSGVYFYKLILAPETGGREFISVRKMILMK